MTKNIKKVAVKKNTPKIRPRKIVSDHVTDNVTFLNYTGKATHLTFTLKPDNIFAGLISPLSAKEFENQFF